MSDIATIHGPAYTALIEAAHRRCENGLPCIVHDNMGLAAHCRVGHTFFEDGCHSDEMWLLARLREVEAERDDAVYANRGEMQKSERLEADLDAAEADAKALADAASKMPDAGLDENDPRYRWWWDVMAPALAAHRERVKPDPVQALRDKAVL